MENRYSVTGLDFFNDGNSDALNYTSRLFFSLSMVPFQFYVDLI